MPLFFESLKPFLPSTAVSIGNTIDAFKNPHLYYKEDRDVVIINRLRKCYANTFTDQPIPLILRYRHEPSNTPKPGEDDYLLLAEPETPADGKYRPICNFPAKVASGTPSLFPISL